MKYRLQRVDLKSFLESEVPRDQLSAPLAEALKEALRGDGDLTAIGREVVRELLQVGTLRTMGRLRSGGERFRVYGIVGSDRAYDLRPLLPNRSPETPPRPRPRRRGHEGRQAPQPPAQPSPDPTPDPRSETGVMNGNAWAALNALRSALQRDWVSFGLDSSLSNLVGELKRNLRDPGLRLLLWVDRLPLPVGEGEEWDFAEGPLASELDRALTASVPLKGLLVEGRRWFPVVHQDVLVGAVGGRQRVDPALLEQSAGAVRDLIAAAGRSQRRVFNDPLTGVHNRGSFERQFGVEMERSRRSGVPLTLLFADLDHFKLVNDQHGHDAGDVVLRTVASLLVAHLRRIDYVFRYGGEEFAMLLPGTDGEEGFHTADRLRAMVAGSPIILTEGLTLHATLSIGGAVFPEDGDQESALLRCADLAMYKAKEAGRNRVLMWSAARNNNA